MFIFNFSGKKCFVNEFYYNSQIGCQRNGLPSGRCWSFPLEPRVSRGAAMQPEGSGVWRALCGSRGLAVPCVIRPPLPFPAPPEPSTPALLPGAASIDIPVFLLYPHL